MLSPLELESLQASFLSVAHILTLWHLLEEGDNFAKDKFVSFFLSQFLFWGLFLFSFTTQCHNVFTIFSFNIFMF